MLLLFSEIIRKENELNSEKFEQKIFVLKK